MVEAVEKISDSKILPILQMSRHIDWNSFLKFYCNVAYVHKTFEKKSILADKVYFKMLEHNVYNRNYVKQHFVACALTRKENEFEIFGRTLFRRQGKVCNDIGNDTSLH